MSRSESCDAAPIPASPFKFSFVDSFRPCKRGGVFSHPYLYEKPPHEGGGLVRSDAARVEYLVDLIRFRHQPCGEVFLDIEGIPWVRVRQILIIGVTGDVVLMASVTFFKSCEVALFRPRSVQSLLSALRTSRYFISSDGKNAAS